MQQLGERVAFYRKKCKLSQVKFAERVNKLGEELPDDLPCDMTRHRISRIERGLTIPSLPEIVAFSLILNVDLNCLIHNVCDTPKEQESIFSELERIVSKMDDVKREVLMGAMEALAIHTRDNIHCSPPHTS